MFIRLVFLERCAPWYRGVLPLFLLSFRSAAEESAFADVRQPLHE